MLLSPLSFSFIVLLGLSLLILFLVRMQPRRYYFIRHGETLLNAEHIRQGADGGLSPTGHAQAERAGKYLVRYHIRRIIASTFERGRETALVINEQLHVPIIYSDLLVERRNPSEIIGKKADDPAVTLVTDQIDGAYHDDKYRYSDEENFVDLKRRAQKALSYLARHGTSETCVVTHGILLKMLISYLLYRRRLTAVQYAKLSFFNAADNANITICEYHPWKFLSPTRGWEVISYNETP